MLSAGCAFSTACLAVMAASTFFARSACQVAPELAALVGFLFVLGRDSPKDETRMCHEIRHALEHAPGFEDEGEEVNLVKVHADSE